MRTDGRINPALLQRVVSAAMIINRKMTITHADFFRTLPQALGSHDYSIENNRKGGG